MAVEGLILGHERKTPENSFYGDARICGDVLGDPSRGQARSGGRSDSARQRKRKGKEDFTVRGEEARFREGLAD